MSKATKCTASLSGMPGGGGNGSQVENGAELLEAARNAYQAIKAEVDAMRQELSPMVGLLDDALERTAMSMRYLEGYSVREIAYRISYSEQHIFRVLERAERKILDRAKDESYES